MKNDEAIRMYETYREDRIRQVQTTKERHGADHYSRIGAMKKKRTFDNPEAAKKAADVRWAKYRKNKEIENAS